MKTKSTLALLALYFGIAVSAVAQDSAGQASAPEDFHRTYSGKIAGKYEVKMDLWKSGNELKGSYKYAGKTSSLELKGNVEPSGEFTMNESVGDKTTGTFSGKLAGDNISGEWSDPDGSKKMSFEAYKTAEFKTKPKK